MSPPDPRFQLLLESALGEREQAAQRRRRRVVEQIDPTHVRIDGIQYVNFCSNDYLGLSHHPAITRAMADATTKFGARDGAAGLISGHTTHHQEAETAIATWKGTEAALLLPSGYQANHAIVQTLGAIAQSNPGGLRFLIDKLSHASIIDAVRGSQMPSRIFPHHGYTKLKRLLNEAELGQLQVVVTESIFSMDGDAANLSALAELKQAHPFFLVLDEAHGSGVYGPDGKGYAAEVGLENIVDASIVTFSKAIGCAGGAICGSSQLIEAAVNFARAYIFTTAVPPGVAAGIAASIGVLQSEPQRQRRVRQLAARVRAETGITSSPADSPIIPVIFGTEDEAMKAAEQLRSAGLLVVAVRPPTVAKGSSRLRITVSSEHTDDEVAQLIKQVQQARK